MFHMSGAAGLKSGQINRKRNFWDMFPKSAVVGFRMSQKYRQNVGWVECSETQQILARAQPNLQN
jgi:hypothetical protein